MITEPDWLTKWSTDWLVNPDKKIDILTHVSFKTLFKKII